MLLDPLPGAGGATTVNRPASVALLPGQPLVAVVVLATALACALAALLSLPFNGHGDGQSSPAWAFNAAAGVALAAALTYGRAALVGVALGAFIFQVGLMAWHNADTPHLHAALPALLALGAALQAGLAAALLRRFLPQPMRLKRWTDLLRGGLLGALLASAIGASVTTAARFTEVPMTLAGMAAASAPAVAHWLNWWVGNSLGALIVTPMVLACIGQPHTLWRARRRHVALPLLVALGLLGTGSALLQRSEEQRARADFATRAAALARQLETRLATATHTLQAVHGALRALPGEQRANSETLWQATQWWWAQSVGLQTVALAVPESMRTHKTGGEDVVDTPGARTTLRYRVPAPAATENLPIDLEAQAPRAAQAGLQRARRQGEMVLLTEPLPGMGRSNPGQVALVQALYRGPAANDAARQALFGAYLLVGFDLQKTLAGLEKNPAASLAWCLHDRADDGADAAPLSADRAGSPPEPARLLAGSAACAAPSRAHAAASERPWQQRVRLADRELLLQVYEATLRYGSAGVGTPPGTPLGASHGTPFGAAFGASLGAAVGSSVGSPHQAAAGGVLLLGLCSTAALGALLLHLTGRSPIGGRSEPATAAATAVTAPGGAEPVEAEAIQLKLEPLMVQPLLQECLESVRRCAEDRGVLLSQPTPGETSQPLTVQADRLLLLQVMTHLLSNAIQYNHEGGAVVVHAEGVEPGTVELTVADTGRGLTPEQLTGLFDPATRLGGANSDPAATPDTGLTTSRRLVELMGGTLEVQSQPGVGSTFKLRLAAPASAQAAGAQAAVTQAPPDLWRVHYVQGPASAQDPVNTALEQHAQIELSLSGLGLDGLSAIRRLRPNLVLLNAQLPDINGLELLRHLKRDPSLAKIPVILVSAHTSIETTDRAVALGALRCAIDPRETQPFLAWIDEVLATPALDRSSPQDRGRERRRDRQRDPGRISSKAPVSDTRSDAGSEARSEAGSDPSRARHRDLSQV